MGIIKEKKEKLGINELNYNEQKKLFNDFVEIGGRIVELTKDEQEQLNERLEKWIEKKEEEQRQRLLEEQKKRDEEIARQRAIAEQEKLQRLLSEGTAGQVKRQILPKEIRPQKPKKPKEPNPTQDFFSRLAARIVCILYGVFSFSGGRFSRGFLDLTLFDLKNSLIECQQILVSILHQDKAFSREIRKLLEETGYPFYYELIYRFFMIYEEELFNSISELRKGEDSIDRGKFIFIKLFKKILSLSRYHPSLYNAFEKALALEKNIRNLGGNVVDYNLRKLYRCYHFLFYKYYPKILNLVDFYYKDEIYMGRRISYSEFLGISEVDSLGYYTHLWKEEDEKEKQKKERQAKEASKILEKEKTEEEHVLKPEEIEELKSLPQAVSEGIRIIKEKVNFREILQYYNEMRDPKTLLPIHDKAFLAGILLEFFDKQFSFLFISSSVQFNIYFDRGQRRDLKGALKDLYFHIDEVYKRLYEYVRIVTDIKKIKEDTFMHSKEQFTRLQQLDLQRNMVSRAIRNQTQGIIEDFEKNLQIIIGDYEKDKRYIQNPDEIISFDTRFAGKKFFRRESVIEIIRKAFYFASALNYLLREGELSGAFVVLKEPVYLKGLLPSLRPEDLNDVASATK